MASNVVIDVRSPAEYDSGHIKAALNLPYDTIDATIVQNSEVTKTSKLLLYCRSGRRSAIARSTLLGMGYQDVTDLGTMEDAVEHLKTLSAAKLQHDARPALLELASDGSPVQSAYTSRVDASGYHRLLKGLREDSSSS